MPLFVIERQFADELHLDAQGAAMIQEINDATGVNWLISFLSADRRKPYSLYGAPREEAIREAARRAGLPADVVMEVTALRPEAFA